MQLSNRTRLSHNRVGHVFQGRYKSIVVEKNRHLLELCRYVVLNPVRSSMASEPNEWEWSSYQATAYPVKVPDFLSVDWILSQFREKKNIARNAYRKFVTEGLISTGERPWKNLAGQFIFGGADFVIDIQSRLSEVQEIGEIPRIQRVPGRPPLKFLFSEQEIKDKSYRNQQIEVAHMQHGYTLKEIADQLKMHYTTVSKILKNSKN